MSILKNDTITNLLQSSGGLGALFLRVPVGLILAGHGAQKLFGWFGGYGLEATGQWMGSIGLAPGLIMALLAGTAEFVGGIALIAGLVTRAAAAVSAITMLVALLVVHAGNGFFLSGNGIEFALALLAASISLTFTGGGRYALDNLLAGTAISKEARYA